MPPKQKPHQNGDKISKKPTNNVQSKCKTCNKTFSVPSSVKMKTMYCKECRVKHWEKTHPKTSPAPIQKPKPQRPQYQKPLKTEVTSESRSAATSAIANRTSRSGLVKGPNSRRGHSAIERLVLSVLDPSTACGQQPIRVNVDQVQLPKFPIQLDNNFVVNSEVDFKIMLVASPIISAVIYSKDILSVSVTGARSIVKQAQDLDPSAANDGYIYVLNNKLGFLADLDTRLYVTAKEDFRRFRMITASMQSQWSGPEIFKSGVQVTARLTDKDDFKEFEPNEKADNTISNVSEVLVTTCQHSNPVFEFNETDRNNDNGAGTFIDPEVEDAAVYTHQFVFNQLTTGPKTFAFNDITLTGGDVPNANTIAQTFLSKVFGKCYGHMSAAPEHLIVSNTIVGAYVAKYPSFKSSPNASFTVYSCAYKVKTVVTNRNNGTVLTNTAAITNSVTADDSTLFVSIFQAIEAYYLNFLDVGTGNTTKVPAGFAGEARYDVDVTVILEIPLNGRIRQNVIIPRDLTASLSRNMIAETPFYDDNFLQPVTSVSTTLGTQYSAQYQTCHLFEFVLDDTTVLGTTAVAHAPNDSDTTVSKSQFDKFQKTMKGMPPALILNDSGFTRTTTGQLKSRGVLSQLVGLVRPLMSVLLPGSRPYINAIGETADVIDQY